MCRTYILVMRNSRLRIHQSRHTRTFIIHQKLSSRSAHRRSIKGAHPAKLPLARSLLLYVGMCMYASARARTNWSRVGCLYCPCLRTDLVASSDSSHHPRFGKKSETMQNRYVTSDASLTRSTCSSMRGASIYGSVVIVCARNIPDDRPKQITAHGARR